MNSTSTQFVPSRRMGIYEMVGVCGDFKENDYLDSSPSMIFEDTSDGTVGPSNKYDHVARKPADKVLRRLAQNREAARKSRLRKKAYVQKLESSKLRLIELTQELQRARRQRKDIQPKDFLQGLYKGGELDYGLQGYSGTTNTGIATFETGYGQWVEEQNRQVVELRKALQSSNGLTELQFFVNSGMRHYLDLFNMKAAAAKVDVFYLMSGMWKTSAERYFSWIGGFRPSELLKVLIPHLEPLSDEQRWEVSNLRQSCQQAEDALSQGMDKLHQIIAETICDGLLDEGNYLPQLAAAMEKLEPLVRFVNQADHLRRETLQLISRILDIHQAARGLLALGEYFQRLRALSSLWASRPREPA
ncbi:transcription factor TGA4-like isoform X2 [Olea europaea var. sylvestris]|uniref:transcription factor TGA4-like isoform X2 n=1 Tax=Olea europaea var. sylvestris TaxID=158386 RepID=UPI000C1D8A92|nr:transcription factor TGA4-like isoform X2 [Olea europaea var. sylvestris]